MAIQIKAARSKSSVPARMRLTSYESDQVGEIGDVEVQQFGP